MTYSMLSPKTSPIQKTPAAPQNFGQNSDLTCLERKRVSCRRELFQSVEITLQLFNQSSVRYQHSDKLLKHTINTKTVDIVRLNKFFDPRLVGRYDAGVLGVNIRKGYLLVTQPAVLFTFSVTPLDGTVRVILSL